MTITNTVRTITQTGNGTTTVWSYNFIIPDTASVEVKLVEIATSTETVLSSSLYSITGIGVPAGGTVTYPVSGTPLASTHEIVISRVVAPTQEVNITNQSTFYANTVMGVWDRLTMGWQELAEGIGRSIRLPLGEGAIVELPNATTRANKLLAFSSVGAPQVLDRSTITEVFVPTVPSNTVSDMVTNTGLALGDRVQTLGYTTAGDGGGALYKVVAAGTGTADGGSYIDLTGTGLQAELQHGGVVKAEQFGVVLDASGVAQERSAEFNTAFAFAVSVNPNTYTGDDGEAVKPIETDGALFSCYTDFTADSQLTLTKSDGSMAENMRIDWVGRVIAITGGPLASHTQERPLPLVYAKVKNCKIHWPRIECEMVCAGIKMKKDIGCEHRDLDLRGFSRYGLWKVQGNDSTWHDPIIKQFYRDPLWVRNGVDPTVWTNWHADCIVVSTKDHQFRGGQIGWGGPCVRLLDGMPTAAAERIPGENCYWDGLNESGDGDYLDGDNGSGDCVFDNMHMMQGPGSNFLAGSGSRYGAYAAYDFTSGNLVVRTIDTPIGILSYCKVSNLSFFDRLDNDSCVHLLFGSQVEITSETTGSATDAKTASTAESIILHPRIRNFASRGSAGSTRYPYMHSMNHQRKVTVSYDNNPQEVYWNGSALAEVSTSWNGDWKEWNRLNRSSGSYNGQVQYQGLLAAGTYTPSVSAAGDFWIAQGVVTINPGSVAVTDGQLVYALVASPAGAGDWLVVNATAAPVNDVTRYDVQSLAPEFITYNTPYVSGTSQRTLHTGDATLSETWLLGSSYSVKMSYNADVLSWSGASEYSFDEHLTVTGSGSGNIITGSVSGLDKIALTNNVGNATAGIKPYDAAGTHVTASVLNYSRTADKWFIGYTYASTKELIIRSDINVSTGSGSPEGVVTAPVGAIWLRDDGTGENIIYAKATGSGNTGWVAMRAELTGTWTPVVADATSGGNAASMTVLGANYVKQGQMVTVTCALQNIDTTGMTGTNTLYITGLPYINSSGGLSQNRSTGTVQVSQTTFSGHLIAYTVNGASHIKISDQTSGAGITDLTVAALTSGTADLYLSLTYMTLV